MWVHGRALCPLQALVPLPATRQAQTVNDEPIKVMNLLFFIYFIWKWGETLENCIFSLLDQSNAFTEPIQPENTLKNWYLKEKHNFKQLYLKSLGQFRVKTNIFSKSIQFSLKQSCFLYAPPIWVHSRGALPPTAPSATASSSSG